MSIAIDEEKCIRCGLCAEICPGSLIKLPAAGPAYIKYPQNCWACASCIKECPVEAISLYLGADLGGLGGKLSARRAGPLTHWIVENPDGSRQTITVDRREANHY